MPLEVYMPKIGMTMTEGTVVRWLKKEGEAVKESEPLAEAQSDKSSFELIAPGNGILQKVLTGEGITVPVKTVVALLMQEGETWRDASLPGTVQPGKSEGQNAAPAETIAVKKEVPDDEDIKATPIARRLAKEHGIDLQWLKPGGKERIREADVLNYIADRQSAVANKQQIQSAVAKQQQIQSVVAEKQQIQIGPESSGPAEVIPLTGIRKAIADNLRKSYDTAVHNTSVTEVDFSELINLNKAVAPAWEKSHGVKPTLNAFIIKAAALALREHPFLNSSLQGDKIILKKYYNIGLAVAVDAGVVVPVIRNADTLAVVEIARQIKEFSERARSGSITPDETSDGTFTITNMGAFQVQLFTPAIHQPQSAILGIGAANRRPVFLGETDTVVARWLSYLCLSYDHRIIQGVPAAKFRITLKDLLEAPYSLLS